MSIIIRNLDGKATSTYEVRINEKVICYFKHKRSNGLGICLLEASKAVEKQKWEEAAEFLTSTKEGGE